MLINIPHLEHLKVGINHLCQPSSRLREMPKKLTLPAPESPTSTIFSRFSADSSSTSDIGDLAKIQINRC